jgi:flagella basal body P-ring formation protein FlgA
VASVGGGAPETHHALSRLLATPLDVPTEKVRVEVVGGFPPYVDSAGVDRAGGGRWIASFWVGDAVSRRFLRVGSVRSIPVAVEALDRGTAVQPEDVAMEERVVWERLAAPPADPVGMVATRLIPAGEALAAPSVRPPLLFKGGDEVDAILERSGLVLRVKAEALSSGREGETVLVRLTSGKRMSARAIGPGLVHLTSGGV